MKIRMAWLGALLMVASASSGVQAADDWKLYRFPEYGFAAEYPTQPKPTNDQKWDPKRIIRLEQYWSDLGDSAYGVNAALFLHNVIAGLPPNKQIDNVIEGVRGSLKCAVRSKNSITFPGATGREIIYDKCPATLSGAKQRIYIVGDWLYQILALGQRPGLVESPDTKRFLESFSLTAR